jgi:copper transporter 1
MFLDWNTIDACILFSSFHVHSSFEFFTASLGSALLVVSLEFLRRLRRQYDRYLRSKNTFLQDRECVVIDEMEEKPLGKGAVDGGPSGAAKIWKRMPMVVMLEQMARGAIHVAQFSVSNYIMLLFV